MTGGGDQPFDTLSIGGLLTEGRGVDVICRCGHTARLGVGELRRHPRALKLWALRQKLSCKKCGSIGDVYVQPQSPSKHIH